MSGEEEIGTLIIVVLKAQNLNDKHFFKQDVYAQLSLNGNVSLMSDEGTTKKTKIDYKGGQHPVWDSELRFPIMKNTAKKFRELEVSCYAKEHRDDSLLGEAKVDMTPTLKSGEFDEWVPLQVNAVQRGEIYLEITYYSNGPAPPQSSLLAPSTSNLTRRPSKMSAADRLYRP
ncbi:C2 domain-containing protein, partial [Lentinula detonsa]